MRKLGLFLFAVALTGCSRTFDAVVRHMCDGAVVVSVTEVGTSDQPTVTTVEPNEDTIVWGHCCDPGAEPDLQISAGAWSKRVGFEEWRDSDGAIVQQLPVEVCDV